MHSSRRNFLTSAGAVAATALPIAGTLASTPRAAAAPAVVGASSSDVKKVERIWVDLPFRPVPARHMHRERPGWSLFEVTRVELANGVVGFGESMVQYGGRPLRGRDHRTRDRPAGVRIDLGRLCRARPSDGAVRCRRQDERRADPSLAGSPGAQTGLHELVGLRHVGRRLGDRMPGCRRTRYTAFKGKARSWFDLHEQCRVLTPTLPGHFQIDFDFNSLLLDSGHASRYLTSLEKYHHIAIFETPIPAGDVEGNRLLRRKTSIPIAMHFGNPPIMTALREEVCDGFVIGGARAVSSITVRSPPRPTSRFGCNWWGPKLQRPGRCICRLCLPTPHGLRSVAATCTRLGWSNRASSFRRYGEDP